MANNAWTFPDDELNAETSLIKMIAYYNRFTIMHSFECHPIQPTTTWHRTTWMDEDETILPTRLREADSTGYKFIVPTLEEEETDADLKRIPIAGVINHYGRPIKQVDDKIKEALRHGRPSHHIEEVPTGGSAWISAIIPENTTTR